MKGLRLHLSNVVESLEGEVNTVWCRAAMLSSNVWDSTGGQGGSSFGAPSGPQTAALPANLHDMTPGNLMLGNTYFETRILPRKIKDFGTQHKV